MVPAPGVVVLLLTASLAAAQSAVQVSTATDFRSALTVPPGSHVQIELTDHITLNADISLDNITSLAIWGSCTTPPPNVSGASSGACQVDMGAHSILSKVIHTSTGVFVPTRDWVQLYVDHVALTSTTTAALQLQGATVWVVQSSIVGWPSLQINKGSLYLLDSTVNTTGTGQVTVQAFGQATAAVPSESSFVLVNTDSLVSQASMQFFDAGGWFVCNSSTLLPSGPTLSVSSQSAASFTVVSSCGFPVFNGNTGKPLVPSPFGPAAVGGWAYKPGNVDYLSTLTGAPGIALAMDPFSLSPPPTPPPAPNATNVEAASQTSSALLRGPWSLAALALLALLALLC